MKNIKKLITILLLLLIIILICILGLNAKFKGSKNEIIESNIEQDFIKEIGLVDNYQAFFSVEKMLNDYIKNVSTSNKEASYSILDKEYTKKNNITKDNVLNKLKVFANYNSNVKIREIYSKENMENKVYYIYCILEKENIGKEFYFILYEDLKNLTYSIEPISKEKYNQEIENTNIELEKKQINQSGFNRTKLIIPTEKERVIKYFKDFIENALYYPEYAYNLLTIENKENAFPTLQKFKEYIDEKRELLLSCLDTTLKPKEQFSNTDEYLLHVFEKENFGIGKYQIIEEQGYNKYICMDYEGNYYIFYATSPLSYTAVIGSGEMPID